jgi:ketosteroid isomerase-like protein
MHIEWGGDWMTLTPARDDTRATREAVERFNEATGRRDVDEMMALMTDDCVFENTFPAPDGARYTRQPAVRGFWQQLFTDAPTATFEAEELFVAGDRCVVRWLYRWGPDAPEKPAHVRGVDVFRVRDGKVAEKLSYVKG